MWYVWNPYVRDAINPYYELMASRLMAYRTLSIRERSGENARHVKSSTGMIRLLSPHQDRNGIHCRISIDAIRRTASVWHVIIPICDYDAVLLKAVVVTCIFSLCEIDRNSHRPYNVSINGY
ncbi:hypothetical protein TNIN_162301 [Trichonephila inaurata madagascariensis]|uniref:Uncharacterized protein n=1 Tax=Trichonephila inaurata madagascariensis TaxID=2747483 RepID=A0A8X6X5N4_9ARAC|nr:hypothetical protein TNIN_162301 [Trichonephila inaurata madagascariensis]